MAQVPQPMAWALRYRFCTMASVDEHHPMGIDVIPPLAPVGYGRIDKGHRGLTRPLLVWAQWMAAFPPYPLLGEMGSKRVLHGRMVIDPFFQPFRPG